MILKDPRLVGFMPWIKFLWHGHITNWFWKDRLDRRLTRLHHFTQMKLGYLEKYIPYVKTLKAEDTIDPDQNPDKEMIFSLWFQGVESAPHVVRQCLNSLKNFYKDRVIILDQKDIKDYITLPDFIWEKWDRKEICAANFSDIVRIELLYEYGGFWFDATDYLFRQIPENIASSDFFMFVTSETSFTHMFVQTCFLRAKKGDPLLKMWRDIVFEYWCKEKRAVDYFIAHFLFRILVTHNLQAKSLFEKMPKFHQDNLHLLWKVYGNKPYTPQDYQKIKEEAFFQKCSYRKQRHSVNEILPGSMADFVINDKIQ